MLWKPLKFEDLFVPGIRKMGAFEGAALLAAPNPLVLHNVGTTFTTTAVRDVYGALKSGKALRVASGRLSGAALAEQIAQLKTK